jgi:hypothetical protein
VPSDINPDSSTKSALVGGESPKVTKPPTLNAEETVHESLKASNLDDAQDSSGAYKASSLPTRAAPSSNPMGASSGPGPPESPKISPMRPRSYGLGTAGGYHPREDLLPPWPKKPLLSYT